MNHRTLEEVKDYVDRAPAYLAGLTSTAGEVEPHWAELGTYVMRIED